MEEIIVIFVIVSLFLIITTFVTISNLLFAPRLKPSRTDRHQLISICVPVRNEEYNIRQLLDSLSEQDYINHEIILLDDDSSDNTFSIIKTYSEKNDRISVHPGRPLPRNWTGKNWACHQLAGIARGDILIFIDADCILHPGAMSSTVFIMEKFSLHLFSTFPYQVQTGFGEKLIVPLMDWILLTLLPLRLVYCSSWSSFVAANGQFMAFTRKAYNTIGGHKAVSGVFVEDMELARLIKKNRLKMMTALGNKMISCKMYSSYKEAEAGFCKNFYPGFKMNGAAFIGFLLFLFLLNVLPFIMCFFNKIFFLQISVILLQRVLICITNKQDILFNALFHLVQMIIMLKTGILSYYKTQSKGLRWKGRNL